MGRSVMDQQLIFNLPKYFISEMDRGSYFIPIAKTAYEKIEVLICCLMFSPVVVLYLYKFTI